MCSSALKRQSGLGQCDSLTQMQAGASNVCIASTRCQGQAPQGCCPAGGAIMRKLLCPLHLLTIDVSAVTTAQGTVALTSC